MPDSHPKYNGNSMNKTKYNSDNNTEEQVQEREQWQQYNTSMYKKAKGCSFNACSDNSTNYNKRQQRQQYEHEQVKDSEYNDNSINTSRQTSKYTDATTSRARARTTRA
jgi:hypothetical protein